MSDFTSIKQWLKSTEDEPLETMGGFFDRRVDSYEDHMRPWRAYYRWLGELIPAQPETLLDLAAVPAWSWMKSSACTRTSG